MSVEVIEFCLCKRNWSRIFEIHGTLESNAINALTALWNAIIFAVEYLEVDLITAVLLEGPFNNTPRTTTVMIQHPFHVFEDEDLRLALDNHTCEFTEQSTASIFKAAALASHRECLARGASDEQVHLALEWFRIKGCDVIVPVGFVKRVVCQISPFTVRVNIEGDEPVTMVRDIYDKYKVGRNDRGLVIVVGYLDHSYHIATGRSLEADLTDLECNHLAQDYLIPSMKAEQPDSGMLYLAQGVLALMSKKEMPQMSALTSSSSSDEDDGGILSLILGVIMFCGFGFYSANKSSKTEAKSTVPLKANPFYTPPVITSSSHSSSSSRSGRSSWGGSSGRSGGYGGGSWGGGGSGGRW